MNKYVLTVMIYLEEGGERDFLEYESFVLPLLDKYGGHLEFRLRPGKENFIYPAGGELPYEIHIISFRTKEDFTEYKNDPERLKHAELAERSVKKIIVNGPDGTNLN